MEFNGFVYFWCFTSTFGAVLLHLVDVKLGARRAGFGAAFGQRNSEFRVFQRRFFAGYLPCLFADSLQAPYLYFLYHSYGFLESQIAILYVAGFATNVLFTVLSVYLVQRTERRLLCLLFIGLNSLSCLMKFSNQYEVLLVSRVMDGIASSLLVAPFNEWYVHEHVSTYDFPREWIGSTFKRIAVLSGYAAIVAGFAAEASESLFKITAFPFLLAVPIMMAGGFWMYKAWPENRQEAEYRPKFWPQFGRGLRAIGRDPNVFLLSAVQALFESCIYMLVFLWTPLFLTLKPIIQERPSFGGIYSTLMASMLMGTLLGRVLGRRMSASQLLSLAAGVALVAVSIVVTLTYPAAPSVAKYQVLLVVLCTFEMSVGIYYPAMRRLQKEALPPADRAAILGLFRIPLNAIAVGGLLILHSRDRLYGNWAMLLLCMLLLALCLLSSLLLHASLRRSRAAQADHFVLQLRGNDNDDSEDEVFS